MYRNAVLQTLNRRLFSAILKKLFEAARNAHIDPYTSKEALQKYPEQSFAQKFGLCNR